MRRMEDVFNASYLKDSVESACSEFKAMDINEYLWILIIPSDVGSYITTSVMNFFNHRYKKDEFIYDEFMYKFEPLLNKRWHSFEKKHGIDKVLSMHNMFSSIGYTYGGDYAICIYKEGYDGV